MAATCILRRVPVVASRDITNMTPKEKLHDTLAMLALIPVLYALIVLVKLCF